jgi:anti-anti-sigma factor
MVVQYSMHQVEPDILVMELTGQLTLGNRLMEVEHVIKQHIEKGSKKLVLDVTKLTFLDSAGIGMVMVCSGAIQQAGGRMLIVGAEGKVGRVLELTHIHEVIGMHSDLASACAAFDAPAPAAPRQQSPGLGTAGHWLRAYPRG